MVPTITVPNALHAGIIIRALVDQARKMINEASDPDQQTVTRRKLVHTAGISLDLAQSLLDYVPDMPTEFPEEFDAELLVWLKNLV